jgi:hypothetical protein
MIQEAQQMVSVSAVGILGIGFFIAIVLLVIGLREKGDLTKKVRLIRAGGFLTGLMVIITGLTWYGYIAMREATIMTLGDVVTLTSISAFGGIISGISLYIPLD